MREQTVYVATDGSRFDDPEDCAEYEYLRERLEALRQGVAQPGNEKWNLEDYFEWIPAVPLKGEKCLIWTRQLKALVEYLYDAELG